MTAHFAQWGRDCVIEEYCVVGHRYRDNCTETKLGDNATIRAFTMIYADVSIGDWFSTGHHTLIREFTTVGSRVLVGSGSVIDGRTTIGDLVKIESMVYIPTHTKIGSRVFIGPGAVLTNDRYPLRLRDEYQPEGPQIEDGVTIGANATILPGVQIGAGSMVAAGSIVTHNIPPWHLAVGVPARSQLLPDHLREQNQARNW